MFQVTQKMSRWHVVCKIPFACLVTMTTVMCLATKVAACPTPCQCTQTYFVYCQNISLSSESLADVTSVVPQEAILLDVGFNNVDILSSGLLERLSNLEYLNLANNRISKIGLGMFSNLQQLKDLNLQHNHLKEVGRGIFINMSRLKKLNLGGNRLTAIQEHAFSLSGLQQLYLQENGLTALRPSQLAGLPLLEYLDLSDNLIQTIEGGSFRDLVVLKKLKLSNNRLSSLAENVFEGLSSLKELFLDRNTLPSLDCFGVPNFAANLHLLDLANNSLISIPADIFPQLRNLKTIQLNHNHISHIGQQAFKDLQLDRLNLAYNFLETIDREMLNGARRISSINLSHNHIHTIKTGVFDNFRGSVYVLNMAGNNLTSIHFGMFRGMQNLQTLNLSHNSLGSILDKSFEDLVRLTELWLDNNKLQWFSADLLKGTSMRTLSVIENPVTELRGFSFEDSTDAISILVNLTVTFVAQTSITVSWPYKEGSQLYWTLQVWCVSETGQEASKCSRPIQEENLPTYKTSETISGLQPGTQYFVCVNPVFLAKDVLISQCVLVSTLSISTSTSSPVGTAKSQSSSVTVGHQYDVELQRYILAVLLSLWINMVQCL